MSSGKLDIIGALSAISEDMRVTGHLAVETGRLTDFVAAMVSATSSEKPFFEAPLVGRFTFDGGIDVGPDRIAISDFAATMGRDRATGSLALTYDGPPTLQGHVKLASLDLEKWLSCVDARCVRAACAATAKPAARPLRRRLPHHQPPAAPAAAAPPASPPQPALRPLRRLPRHPPSLRPGCGAATAAPPAKPAASAAASPPAKPPAKPAAPAAAAAASPLPAQMNASLIVDVEEMAYRRDRIRDLSIAIDVDKGVIAVTRFKATLPGDMAIEGSSGSGGSFSLSGARLRDTLEWLGVDTGIPRVASRPSRPTANWRRPEWLSGQRRHIRTRRHEGKGGGTIVFGPPISANVTVEADRIDLDAYMPRRAGEPVLPVTLDATPAAAATPPRAAAPPTAAPILGLRPRSPSWSFAARRWPASTATWRCRAMS
jgi:hypothetical protein